MLAPTLRGITLRVVYLTPEGGIIHTKLNALVSDKLSKGISLLLLCQQETVVIILSCIARKLTSVHAICLGIGVNFILISLLRQKFVVLAKLTQHPAILGLHNLRALHART